MKKRFTEEQIIGFLREADNVIVWRWDSDPFGTTAASEDPDGDSVNFVYNPRFPGQYYDAETGLNYNYFRDYDSQTGRYVQSDPIGLDGGSNTFAYAGNNPMANVDPYGLFWWQAAGCGIGLAFDWDAIYKCDECGKCEIDWVRAAISCGSGAIGGGTSRFAWLGKELSFGKNFRVAPFGNRTGHPTGRLPHYHRRGVDSSTGQTLPGQGMSRHRPWDSRSTDTSWRDRL